MIWILKITCSNVHIEMHVVCMRLKSGATCICIYLTAIVMCDVLGGVLGTETRAQGKRESCDIVKSRCGARVGCAMALHNFFLGCNDLMYGDITECSVECTRTLISLMSTEDGVGFMECDCEGVESCEERKKNVEVCTTSVMEAVKTLNDSSVVSCTLARWLCEADSSCLTALSYYISYCESLLEGITCTPRCNNSLSILYRQPKAAKLINCSCEGNEEFDCVKIRRNTERLCFNRDVPYHLKGTDPTSTNCGTTATANFYNLISVFLVFLLLFIKSN